MHAASYVAVSIHAGIHSTASYIQEWPGHVQRLLLTGGTADSYMHT